MSKFLLLISVISIFSFVHAKPVDTLSLGAEATKPLSKTIKSKLSGEYSFNPDQKNDQFKIETSVTFDVFDQSNVKLSYLQTIKTSKTIGKVGLLLSTNF